MNRAVNPLMRVLLRSPAHRLLSCRVALITVTGRRTGRSFTFPVGYQWDGDRVTIVAGSPERKRWWRNLREPAPVTLQLRDVRYRGSARAVGDERSGVIVEVELDNARGGDTA